MVSIITVSKAQNILSDSVRAKRLQANMTQKELAERSGVPLPTLRKFEQKSVVSLESYIKLLMVLGGVDNIIKAVQPSQESFTSIDEVLDDHKPQRKRARKP